MSDGHGELHARQRERSASRRGSNKLFDVIIVGGGPAGLSAALVLGRARRRVLLCDTARPRNAASHALHAFISRDGIAPAQFRRIARKQLAPYVTVVLIRCEVTKAKRTERCFQIVLSNGAKARSRTLLLATGRKDILPAIQGAPAYFGRGVFLCPYCDGWENRDQPIVVYGNNSKAADLALELLDWSKSTVLCTDGRPKLTAAHRRRLSRYGIRVVPQRIARLEGDQGKLKQVRFRNGQTLPTAALYFYPRQLQQSSLAAQLGCRFNRSGDVGCDGHSRTNIPGVHVAGNMRCGLQLAIVAAAEGAEAAYVIHSSLLEQDYR